MLKAHYARLYPLPGRNHLSLAACTSVFVCVCVYACIVCERQSVCVCVFVCMWAKSWCCICYICQIPVGGRLQCSQESPSGSDRMIQQPSKQVRLNKNLLNQQTLEAYWFIFSICFIYFSPACDDAKERLIQAAPSPRSPTRGSYCSLVFLTWSLWRQFTTCREESRELLCARLPPQADLPVCLHQQKLTVEAFEAASPDEKPL